MFTFKTQAELDTAYKAGQINKRDYRYNYRTLNPLLDPSDNHFRLIRDREMTDGMNQLDRERGIGNPNNYRDMFVEEAPDNLIGTAALCGGIAVLYAAPQLVPLAFRAIKDASKLPMPKTVRGNVTLSLVVNTIYDVAKNGVTPKQQQMNFEWTLNHSSLSNADKKILRDMYHRQEVNQAEVMGMLNNVLKETFATNKDVAFIKETILAEKAEKLKAQKFRQNTEAAQNSVLVLGFIAAKIDPQFGRMVNTIGNVAINVGSKIAAAAAKMSFGLVMGVMAAILPLLDLFGDDKDINAERHKEIMEAFEVISGQITELRTEMHERFNWVHQHLTNIESKIDNGFYRILLALQEEITTRLENIADAIDKQSYLQTNRFSVLREDIYKLVNTVEVLDTNQYDIKLEEIQDKLYPHINKELSEIDSSFVKSYISEIYTHINKAVQSPSYIGTVCPTNAAELFGKNVLDNIHYLQKITNEQEIPNFYAFSEATNILIAYSTLFNQLPDIDKISRLGNLKEKTVDIQQRLKKMTNKQLIGDKYNTYCRKAEEVVKLLTQKMRELEMRYLKGLSIPLLYSNAMESSEPSVIISTNATKDINYNLPIVVFKHHDKQCITGFDEKNIFEALQQIRVFECKYGDQLTEEELKHHNLTEFGFARWITVTFLTAKHGEAFNLGEVTCIATETYEQGNAVYCLDVTHIYDSLKDKLENQLSKSRSVVLFNKPLSDLNFAQMLYLVFDYIVNQTKSRIFAEVLETLVYEPIVKEFEQSAADFLCLSTLNRVCTNPYSVHSQVNTYDIDTAKATLDNGYRISYSNELYTLIDMVYMVQNIMQSTTATDLVLPTSSFIDYAEKCLIDGIKAFTQPTIDGLGDPGTYCCPPILHQTISVLEQYAPKQQPQ